MYIAPSSNLSLLTRNLPFEVILEIWGGFLMSGVRMLHFSKDWWTLYIIHLLILHVHELIMIKYSLYLPKDTNSINSLSPLMFFFFQFLLIQSGWSSTNSNFVFSILPTVNTLIRRRGRYNAWKLSTWSFQVRIEMLRLINKMSAKILNFWIGWHKPLKFWKCSQMSQ